MAETAEQYELIERIAVGGMAEVFRANRLTPAGAVVVAVKRILPSLAADAEFVARFVEEARLASALGHDNIVPAIDHGQFGDSLFIAMEYMDAGDLAALMVAARERGAPMDLTAARHVASGLLDGLRFAHDHGVMHRDVSPANVLLSRRGAVKITDFGIAKAAGVELTNQRRVMGKWPYMSPEQVTGADLDARTDLFSAGAVLYELFVGERLFRGSGPMEIRRAIREAPIEPPIERRPEIPRAISDAIVGLLERDRERRVDASAALAAFGGGDANALATAIAALNPAVPADTDPSLLLLDDVINSELAHARAHAPGKRVTLAATAASPRLTEANPARGARRTFVKTGMQANGLSQWLIGDPSGSTYAIQKTALLYAVDDSDRGNDDGDDSTGDASHDSLDGAPAAAAIEPPAPRHTILDATGGPADGRSNPPVPLAEARGRRWGWLWLVLTLAAIGALAVVFVQRGKRGPAPVSITSEPSGAEVWVGERQLGVTPLSVEHPGAGESVELRLEGHAPCTRVLEPAATTVRCNLVRARARLTVMSDPEGASVWLDGDDIGTTPLRDRELEARGQAVTIELRKAGYRSATARVLLAAGSTSRVSKQLVAEVAEGTIDIVSTPATNIYFRGKKIGEAPITGLRLPEGQHQLTLVNPTDSRRVTITVTVPSREPIVVTLPE